MGGRNYALLNGIPIDHDGLAHCLVGAAGIGGEIDLDLIKRKQMARLS